MNFSEDFKRVVTYPFRISDCPRYSSYDQSTILLSSNRVHTKNLIIDITKENIEIPSIARKKYESIICDCRDTNVEKIILPLYTNLYDQNFRNFFSIIREFFCKIDFIKRLGKITTSKGEVYYGGRGLILDDKFDPILMCCLKARKINNEAGVRTIQYYGATCHISPKVFAEPSRLIHKGIIQKLIPLYTNIGTELPLRSYFISADIECKKVEVIVDDFSKFFTTPIAPTKTNEINDALNKCLNDNIEDILYMV